MKKMLIRLTKISTSILKTIVRFLLLWLLSGGRPTATTMQQCQPCPIIQVLWQLGKNTASEKVRYGGLEESDGHIQSGHKCSGVVSVSVDMEVGGGRHIT